jgi:hypothetical protein
VLISTALTMGLREAAKRLVGENAVELWHYRRMVARLEATKK